MSKKEKEAPVVVTWWKLITILVTFAVALLIVIAAYNIYLKSIAG